MRKNHFIKIFYFLGEGKICSEGNYKEHFKIVLDNGVEITQFDNNLLKIKSVYLMIYLLRII